MPTAEYALEPRALAAAALTMERIFGPGMFLLLGSLIDFAAFLFCFCVRLRDLREFLRLAVFLLLLDMSL